MPLPREIPEGLNGRQYSVLALQYTLIGDWTNATAAQTRALKCNPNDFVGTPLEKISKEDMGRANFVTGFLHGGFTAGKHISTTAEFLSHELTGGLQKANAALDNAVEAHPQIKEAKQKITGLWHSAGQQLGTIVGKTIEDAVMKNAPSRNVPEGLSAQEYFDLGVQYKNMGWTEQSRDALNYAKEHDPAGDIASKADSFIKTRLPRHPVPHVAVQRNILGFNYMAANRTEEARQVFEKLIEDYPTFEWPYSNLGNLYANSNKTHKAKELLWHALDINPNYSNAWRNLAVAKILDSEFDDARDCLEKAERFDPENPALEQTKQMLNFIDNFRQRK